MIVHPKESYTLTQLNNWFMEAQQKGEDLYLIPCNPEEYEIFQTYAIIKDKKGLATLTQWLGGLKP